LPHDQAMRLVESFLRFLLEITAHLVVAEMMARQRFGISYWDGAIVEAGRSLGCEVILSEDLSDGTDYDGVRVENPFRGR
jgi:predicted nucleic acid-binding protein